MDSDTDMKTMLISQKQKIANPIINVANRFGFLDTYSLLKGYCRSQITILMFHRIGPAKNAWLLPPTNTSDFEDQMKYLSKTHKILSLNELATCLQVGKPLAKKVAIVTFDDGYKDNYQYAFPILKKYKIPATIFLVTGHIDTGNLFWFDKIRYIIWNTKINKLKLDGFGDFSLNSIKNRLQTIFTIVEKLKKIKDAEKNDLMEKLINISKVDIPHDLGRDVILSWDEVKEMNDWGIDFGAHTISHPILTKIPLEQAKFEILQSKKDIEKRLEQSVYTFAYPNGTYEDFDTKIIDLVKESGFTCAVTTIPTIKASKMNLYKLGRQSPGWSFLSFKFIVSGLYSDVNDIFSRIRRGDAKLS
jgi:peptidoglycan/xylan/chitin deacetylase (PgdA/CDA1 family)